MLFELADGREGIHSVPGEAGHALRYDQVNLSCERVLDHSVKAISVFGTEAADAFVRVHTYEFPVSMRAYGQHRTENE